MKNKSKTLKSDEEVLNEKLDRIVIALERIANILETKNSITESEYEEGETGDYESERSVVKVPSEIKFASAEELAAKLVDFTKKEFPDNERMYIRNVSQLFWGQKNVSKWNMPSEIQLKIEKAEMLAQKQFETERDVKEREQLEKEKMGLPTLVGSCIDWAKDHGLKRVTQADVDAFLLDKNIDILSQTKRSLYAMANVSIKSKR